MKTYLIEYTTNNFTSLDNVKISANIQSAQSSPPQKRNR